MAIDYYKLFREKKGVMYKAMSENLYLNTGKYDPFEILNMDQIRRLQQGQNPATGKPIISSVDLISGISVINTINSQNAQRRTESAIIKEQSSEFSWNNYDKIISGISGLIPDSIKPFLEIGVGAGVLAYIANKGTYGRSEDQIERDGRRG